MRCFWVNVGLVLALFFAAFLALPYSPVSAASATPQLAANACADKLTSNLTPAQALILEAGVQAVKQMTPAGGGKKWIHVTADIALVRGELERLSTALTKAGADKFSDAQELLDKIKAWIKLKNGNEISLADYNVTSFKIVSMLGFLKYDHDPSVTREQLGHLRPVNQHFNPIDFSFNGDVYVRLAYRSSIHPLKFLKFYQKRVLLWEAPIETHYTDGVPGYDKQKNPDGYPLQIIAYHDFGGHQGNVFRDFRRNIGSGLHSDYEFDSEKKSNEFFSFIETIFTGLTPHDYKYQLYSYLLWYPVHENGVPPTLKNILAFYEKGMYSDSINIKLRNPLRYTPEEFFSYFLKRITDTTNLGRDFARFRTDVPAADAENPHLFELDIRQIENTRDELLNAIRAFQAQSVEAP